MYYYEPDEKRGRRAGAIAAAVYVAAWIALMLFASMSIERPDTEQGILVNFGSVDDAGGKLDMALSDRSERVSAPNPENPRKRLSKSSRSRARRIPRLFFPASLRAVSRKARGRPRARAIRVLSTVP